MHKHHSALGLAATPNKASNSLAIANERPVQPVTLIRPHAAQRAARFFVEKFQGKSLYAVKANPSPELITLLWESGITHFDVASIAEVRLVARMAPAATLCFMHPVKAEEAMPKHAHMAARHGYYHVRPKHDPEEQNRHQHDGQTRQVANHDSPPSAAPRGL